MNNENVNVQYNYEMPRKGGTIPSPESSMSPGYPPETAFRGPNTGSNPHPHHHLHQTTGYVSKC